MVGTKSGDIYDITEKTSSSQPVVSSHTEGEIWGLCAHPEKDVFVTGSDDKTVRLWDLAKKVSIMFVAFVRLTTRHDLNFSTRNSIKQHSMATAKG